MMRYPDFPRICDLTFKIDSNNELVFERVALTGSVRQFDREYISKQDRLRRASGSPVTPSIQGVDMLSVRLDDIASQKSNSAKLTSAATEGSR